MAQSEVDDTKCTTIFDELASSFMTEVDAPKIQPSMHKGFFKLAYDLLRILRAQHPEAIVPIVLLSLPKLDSAWDNAQSALMVCRCFQQLPQDTLSSSWQTCRRRVIRRQAVTMMDSEKRR